MKKKHFVLLSILSGVLLSLPWFTAAAGWVLLFAFVPLLLVEDFFCSNKEQNSHIEFLGYSFLSFLTWNLLSCYWIGRAVPFGMIVIVTLNALLMSAAWWMFHRMKREFNVNLANISLLAFWLAFEYLHFNWDMEWPWLTLGNGFANQVRLIQWYEFTGVLGGSLLILAANLILLSFLKNVLKKQIFQAVFYLFVFCAVIFIPFIWSNHYYLNYVETGEKYDVLVLQPNVDPYTEKFDDKQREKQIATLLELTDSLLNKNTALVIAPETALPTLTENDSLLTRSSIFQFRKLAQQSPLVSFVVGVNTLKYYSGDEKLSKTARWDADRNQYFDIYNSALLVNENPFVQIYHKGKLVSGVEKMPFSKYFSFIERYIVDLGGATGSLGRQNTPTIFITNSGLKVAPVICFESVFGQYISTNVMNGAELIVMLTDDGWWEGTIGYRQHLAISSLRAIETRRSIARSANTGISALINQRGDILKKTTYGVKTAMKGNLRANEKLTFYVKYGDYLGRISAFVTVLLLLYFFVQKRIKEGN
ncbi:apolipoprotein N-acyltransferase [Sunxiuqinia indica]|uniref:apolipoprotein N-acyltransferase n=1 Tax=Sunxiuqinia indica TaxID=2692584 RepID=UPI00135C3A10|nr:apolipoprotein N-acyltransferase [Sunxiuqinia indica]